MRSCGIKDICVHLVPDARHDIFHEESVGCMKQVITLIKEWMNV